MAHGGGPGASGSSNTSSLGSSSGSSGQSSASGGGSGATGGSKGSGAGAAGPVFMPVILGTACHGERSPVAKEAPKVAALSNQALNELAEMRADKPDVDLSAYSTALNAIHSRPLDMNGPNAAKQLADMARQLELLLEEMRKTRMIALANGQVVSAQMLPGWQKMNASDRARAAEELVGKLARGEAIAAALRDPNGTPPAATKGTVSDLMFYLRAQTDIAARGPWNRGAASMPDPGGRIRAWLNSTSKAVYMRPSSHLKPDQKGRGHTGRGIDFDQGGGTLDGRLPYGARTLLFQGFTRDGIERLYFKVESEGTRVNPYNFMGGVDESASAGMHFADVMESLRHLNNLRHKERDDSGLPRHGEKFEDLPRGVRDAYGAILAAVASDPNMSLGAEQGGKFDDEGELKEMTVSQMNENLTNLAASMASSKLTTAEQQALASAILGWNTAAQTAWGPSYAQDLPSRVGDEVILRDEHLPPIPR